ncbi:PLP-dependent transferase [Periconia macrospinosa]|uniref:PLP-dependent transferase n=1 Tax=Periconia macrospinosa TaxID=97972 RepID=A0A2V1DG67_9PLEO|nr:PLP-dependent transferase [Periconia macrospinosa]
MARIPTPLWKNLIAVQVYGANTGVGKTVFSTLLGSHFLKRRANSKWSLRYIKPVSTGPADEADDGYFQKYTGSRAVTLYQFKDAVSPHVAARDAEKIPSDGAIVQKLFSELRKFSPQDPEHNRSMGLAIVETAGGVLSPGPSGIPQADLFRPLRMPVILVGDHRLGGIACTISASESLIMRGYDIAAVVCFDDKGKYKNSEYLRTYFEERDIAAFELPWIPDLHGSNAEYESAKMREYYGAESNSQGLYNLADHLIDQHSMRLKELDSIAVRTSKSIWHPFTQHRSIEKPEDILVFDSAYGDYFQTKHTTETLDSLNNNTDYPVFYPAFDGSASWWTQGLGHGNPKLSLAAAYAAGRYGHVMFAGATHQPAITLAEKLLAGLKNPRLTKCFYTDNGSTAAEVAIKMALRASCRRYNRDGSSDIGVLGLKGSYHGDTIGAMDASEPCVYNKKVDWYRGRGYWLDFPTVKMRKGKWIVEPPTDAKHDFGDPSEFDSLDDVFDFKKREPRRDYHAYITQRLDSLVKHQGRKFGALIMEPVILGAGGMLFVDPVFQRALVNVVRRYKFDESVENPEDANAWAGLPIVFDEVFTGLYRLGRFSSASFLETHPDISIHAKLLTGGLLPLSATVASDSIFDAFLGEEKSDALLHGHSYTAHAIGCHIGNTSLQAMEELDRSSEWQTFRKEWQKKVGSAPSQADVTTPYNPNQSAIWSMWSQRAITEISHHPLVDHLIAIGSVLAVSLKDHSGSGYTSTAAIGLRDALLKNPLSQDVHIHSRVLGNVIYLMASMTSTPDTLSTIESAFEKQLDTIFNGSQ